MDNDIHAIEVAHFDCLKKVYILPFESFCEPQQRQPAYVQREPVTTFSNNYHFNLRSATM